MREKFYFFNSFRDTIKSIEDEKLRLKYCEAIIDYGITGEINTDDPIIKSLMVQTKFVMDKSINISDVKSEKMIGNKNAVKTYKNISKQKKTEKTDKNKVKQKKQEEEVEEEVEVEVEDISDTIVSDVNSNELTDNNISDTNILNIIQTGQKQKKFGNEEVNECMEMVQSVNDGAMDGTKAKNRQFAYNLIGKIKEMPSVANGKITWQEVLNMIIVINKDDKYYSSKITSPENIYRNFGSLINQTRMKIQEERRKQQGVF